MFCKHLTHKHSEEIKHALHPLLTTKMYSALTLWDTRKVPIPSPLLWRPDKSLLLGVVRALQNV